MERVVYMQSDVDCLRAAFATLADVDYDELPDIEPRPGMFEAYKRWAADRGKRLTVHPGDALPVDRERWLGLIRVPPATGFVQSTSRDGLNRHTVVMRYGEVSHDPLPYRDAEHDRLVGEAGIALGLTIDDELDEACGNLTGKTAPVGGNWAGAGDADDFAIDTVGHTAQRTAVSDASLATGRLMTLTPSFTNTIVQTDFQLSVSIGNSLFHGVLLRYVDANNWVAATQAGAKTLGRIYKCVGGTLTLIGDGTYDSPFVANTWYTVRAVIDQAGRWMIWLGLQGSALTSPLASGSDSDLATGGALASGKCGLYDAHNIGTACTRSYDNFFAGSFVPDAAIFAGKQLEFRYDGYRRQDSTGAIWADVSSQSGDNVKLLPAGREGRQNRVVLDTCRNDPDTSFDVSLSKIQLQVVVTPRYLSIPAS